MFTVLCTTFYSSVLHEYTVRPTGTCVHMYHICMHTLPHRHVVQYLLCTIYDTSTPYQTSTRIASSVSPIIVNVRLSCSAHRAFSRLP